LGRSGPLNSSRKEFEPASRHSRTALCNCLLGWGWAS
jgi:hypothetical protein